MAHFQAARPLFLLATTTELPLTASSTRLPPTIIPSSIRIFGQIDQVLLIDLLLDLTELEESTVRIKNTTIPYFLDRLIGGTPVRGRRGLCHL
ncbi:hypothetical protein M6B38_233585 [Iris pallida]|uniref:Uncharacterized protein n=1 Tax=Iris pallida TaxID=29817 RepID=A0AAX6DQH4_IRIPA|nr:hypothetical protein M6B38_233585 [Iris pallida]